MNGILLKYRTVLISDSVLVEKTGTGRCMGYCSKKQKGTWRRQNTAYVNDESNWACYCKSCQIEADLYWQGMWDDYYSNCL